METENSVAPDVVKPEEADVEKVVPMETPDAEKLDAGNGATELAVNTCTEEQKSEMKDSPTDEKTEQASSEVITPEQQSHENGSDPIQASTPCLQNVESPVPPNDSEVPPLIDAADAEPEKSAEPEKLPQLVESEKPAHVEPPNSEENASQLVETTTGSVVSSEKPTEATKQEEQKEEKVSVAESDPVKAADTVTEVASEQTADPQNVENPSPALGSLSFALLEKEQTKKVLLTSQTLVVLRGLPGSGKSFLARAIADAFKDHCTVICADDHGVVPEKQASCADGYKALDDALVARCGGETNPVLIVVDDTNHTQDRLARLGEIATEHKFLAIFLEPHTEWNRDPAQLSKKSKRGLEPAQIEAMKLLLNEVTLPLFFGWFLVPSSQDKIRCSAMDFLKTLDTLEAFKKHLADFTGKAEKEVDLEQYFKPTGALHCTTKFCDYGKAEGAAAYAQKQVVKDLYGSVFELSLSAFFVTPRTVGARVSLTEEELQLWPEDSESSIPGSESLPLGSRAHVTLGVSAGVEPVQTGLDLLEILALQKNGQQGEVVEEMELGSLTYYGEGRWMLSLREPIGTLACFSSFYGRKEAEPVKLEKKKKPKCTIL